MEGVIPASVECSGPRTSEASRCRAGDLACFRFVLRCRTLLGHRSGSNCAYGVAAIPSPDRGMFGFASVAMSLGFPVPLRSVLLELGDGGAPSWSEGRGKARELLDFPVSNLGLAALAECAGD